MNSSNASSASSTAAVKLADLVPSLSLRFGLHALDACCSLTTFITLSRWRKMRSFSMSLICMMMASEFIAALVLGSLEGWHLLDYATGTSESNLTGNQCYWRTGYEGPVLVLIEVSALMVSLDRVFSIVAPTTHEQLPFGIKALAFPMPFVCSTIVMALLASSTIKRMSSEICTSSYISYDSAVGAVGLMVAHTVMNVGTYGTAVSYAGVLILIFIKYKVHKIGNGEHVNIGSLEAIKARRYKKMTKVLAFSAICYFLTSSTANTVYLYLENRRDLMMVVAHFFHGLYAVDGIVTFTAFLLFIPSFKGQLLRKPDSD
uniref:Vomeronasal type-1 receptor n=1 Tax=Romanomermis culicivorax TaxID=13658 RepID=A0A915ING4_ROMCU